MRTRIPKQWSKHTLLVQPISLCVGVCDRRMFMCSERNIYDCSVFVENQYVCVCDFLCVCVFGNDNTLGSV